MIIDATAVYRQKMSDINSRINSKISNMTDSNKFSSVLQSTKEKAVSGTVSGGQAIDKNGNLSDYALYINGLYNNRESGQSDLSDDTQLESIISEKSKLYNINENLVNAVIKAESGFNASAVSGAGAVGLMQLMPSTAQSLGVTNPYDPVQNIDGGIRYLKNQINNFNGDVKMALAAYNCGPTRLRNLNITNLDDSVQFAKLPKETQNYVNKIMGFLK